MDNYLLQSTLTVGELVHQLQPRLSLEWLAGQTGAGNVIRLEGTSGADLVGHLNLVHPTRIQVIGAIEMAWMQRLEPPRRAKYLQEIAGGRPPAVMMADGLDAPQDVLDVCEEHGLPLLASPKHCASVIDILRIHLSKRLAQRLTRHGVMMDVLGLGVLITGESGLGKSELALELISRGHGLVADDAVELARIAPETLEGRCPTLTQNMLEIRGLGLLDIRAIFGETAVRRKKKLKLIVHLIRRSTLENEYERLPLDTLTEDVLGVHIKKVVVPVAAGRNIAVLLEAAVRNTILQFRGIDSTREFMQRQMQAMQDAEPSG